MKIVEIFSIGNELLRGIVADSNSGWMAARIAARGASLARVVTLPDDPPVVATELQSSLERKPALILTQGGLGPTDDDRTREAVSRATGRSLEENDEARAIVARRYRELHEAGRVADASLGVARLRMAWLPHGATALDNQVGAAPGLVLPLGETTIVSLPGVPPELQWIWEHPLGPVLDEVLGPGGWAEVTVTLEETDESRLALALREVAAKHPSVYLKSRAKGFESSDRIRITLTASAGTDAAAKELVDSAFADLKSALAGLGVPIR